MIEKVWKLLFLTRMSRNIWVSELIALLPLLAHQDPNSDEDNSIQET